MRGGADVGDGGAFAPCSCRADVHVPRGRAHRPRHGPARAVRPVGSGPGGARPPRPAARPAPCRPSRGRAPPLARSRRRRDRAPPLRRFSTRLSRARGARGFEREASRRSRARVRPRARLASGRQGAVATGVVTALPRGPQLGRRCTGYTLELPRGGARSMPERGVDVLARARQRSPRPARPRRRERSIVSSQTANARRSVRYARAGSLRRVHRARGSGRSLRRSRRPHSAATRPCLLRVPGAGGGRQPLAAPYPYGMPGRRFDSQVSDDVPKRPADPAVRRANLRRIFLRFGRTGGDCRPSAR